MSSNSISPRLPSTKAAEPSIARMTADPTATFFSTIKMCLSALRSRHGCGFAMPCSRDSTPRTTAHPPEQTNERRLWLSLRLASHVLGRRWR